MNASEGPRWQARGSWWIATSLAALVVGCGGEALDPPQGPASSPLVGAALEGTPLTTQAIDEFSRETGLQPHLVVTFVAWPRQPDAEASRVVAAGLDAAAARGAVPVITWEPWWVEDGREERIPATEIVSGRFDPYVDAVGAALAAHPGVTVVRFGHEMNLGRYAWGGSPDDFGPAAPGRYVAMFRHVVARLRAAGAGRTLICFCPNAESVPHPIRDGASWNTVAAWWPGRDVVDLLGMDGYNWGTTRRREVHGWESSWRSFGEIFRPARDELLALAPDLPLVVMETGCVSQGGDATAWVEAAATTAREWRLGAVVWFHADKENDWKLPGREPEGRERLRRALTPLPRWLERGWKP